MLYRQNLFGAGCAISFGWRDVYVDGATVKPTNNSGGKMEKRGAAGTQWLLSRNPDQVDLPAREPYNWGEYEVIAVSLFKRSLSIIDIDMKRSKRRLHGVVANTMPCLVCEAW